MRARTHAHLPLCPPRAQPDYYWWILVILLRKLVIAGITLAFVRGRGERGRSFRHAPARRRPPPAFSRSLSRAQNKNTDMQLAADVIGAWRPGE